MKSMIPKVNLINLSVEFSARKSNLSIGHILVMDGQVHGWLIFT
jgi:hypothetical protein